MMPILLYYNQNRHTSLSDIERWRQRFNEAARYHGDECVGLAIGVRAVDIVLRELGDSDDGQRNLEMTLGTKSCLGDAFEFLLGLERGQVEYLKQRTDTILAKNGSDAVTLQLTPKKITAVADVFSKSEEDLFPMIRRVKVDENKH